MIKVTWRIDAAQTVHVAFCPRAEENHALPYHPLVPPAVAGELPTTPDTVEEMIAHVVRPDFKDGHHSPSILTLCSVCLPAGPAE